eukprot:scaffold281636_cov35-Tisochrysis_lutea.AAC.2
MASILPPALIAQFDCEAGDETASDQQIRSAREIKIVCAIEGARKGECGEEELAQHVNRFPVKEAALFEEGRKESESFSKEDALGRRAVNTHAHCKSPTNELRTSGHSRAKGSGTPERAE